MNFVFAYSRPITHIPKKLLSFLIPTAKYLYQEVPGGAVLSQWITIDGPMGFTLWLHLFIADNGKLQFKVVSPLPVNTLHYTLEGEAKVQFGPKEEELYPTEYHLFYLPAHTNYEAEVTQKLTSLHIDLGPDLRDMLIGECPDLAFLKEGQHPDPQGKVPVAGKHNYLLQSRIREILYYHPKRDGPAELFFPAKVKAMLRLYALDYAQYVPEIPNTPADQLMAEKVKRHIDTHLHTPLKVYHLAAGFFISESSLSNKFIEYTGSNIGTYILTEKMKVAAELLKNSTIPIHKIAGSLGYNYVEHFNRLFRRKHGMTPGVYRTSGGDQ